MDKSNDIKRSYIRLCLLISVILLSIILTAEFVMFKRNRENEYMYKIEINRAENEIARSMREPGYKPDLSSYKTIRDVREVGSIVMLSDPGLLDGDFVQGDSHYVFRNISGTIYRIDYEVDLSDERKEGIIIVNVILAAVTMGAAGIMVFLYFTLISGFCRLSDYPGELSKGHLTVPLNEKKSKYFGKFLWGLDMLREKLEDEKRKNLELQKERNVFLLSLSHDIKTPLSAIKLYAASIRKNLYKDEDRIIQVAEKIDEDANEIESYVSKIISSSADDFLDFTVEPGEFYLSEAVGYAKNFYADKLKAVGTEFCIGEYSDVLIKGDKERLIEVIQNIIENAIKYGDGRRIGMEFGDEEDCKLITIANSGCTLPEEETEHIFDGFYRGSNVGNKSGSGLGLYICKKLMSRMNGEIFAETENGTMKITLVCARG